jgi:hypothetical protein
MKHIFFTLGIFFLSSAGSTFLSAQSVEDILTKYYENTGGKDAWAKVEATRTIAKIKAQGMEFPATMVQTTTGKQKVSFSFQGMEIVQPCFDGEAGWQTNFMTMKAEKMEAEDNAIMKQSAEDFPDAFLRYKERGYALSLEGSETVEGTDCFKLKMTKKPYIIDGKEEENVTYYFFEKENYVPILTKSVVPKGPGKGMMSETVLSDYQDVNGLLFPFTIEQKFNGVLQAAITTEKVEINPAIDPSIFNFPADK